MNLKRLVNKAIKAKPLPSLSWIYGDYYSPYYSLMYLLAGTIKNGLLVELGVESGRGLASMVVGSKGIRTIDKDNHNLTIGLDSNWHPALNLVLHQYPEIMFFNWSSMPVPDIISKFGRKIGLLHIDTEHSYSMAKAEFEAYKPYLAKGAYVLFDDLHAQDDDVLRYFNELPYKKVQDDRLHPGCGYGVMIYE